jgi:hypothetical protein
VVCKSIHLPAISTVFGVFACWASASSEAQAGTIPNADAKTGSRGRNVGCAVSARPTIRPVLWIRPQTRITVETFVDPRLAAQVEPALASPTWYKDSVVTPIFMSLVGRLADPAIFARTADAPPNKDNISITARIGYRTDDNPYCVELIARQGSTVWRSAINRPGLIDSLGWAISPGGYLVDGRLFYSTGTDLQYLVGHLQSAIRIEGGKSPIKQ